MLEEQTLTHIGIGGLFALAILKVVFDFLKGQRNNKNGSTPITKTDFEKHKGTVQYKDTCGEIVKRFDGRFDSIDESLKDVKTLIQNGH